MKQYEIGRSQLIYLLQLKWKLKCFCLHGIEKWSDKYFLVLNEYFDEEKKFVTLMKQYQRGDIGINYVIDENELENLLRCRFIAERLDGYNVEEWSDKYDDAISDYFNHRDEFADTALQHYDEAEEELEKE